MHFITWSNVGVIYLCVEFENKVMICYLQVALLDVALKRNLVICLGSSSAKQFLAVMLIKKLAYQTRHDSDSEKLRSLALFSTGKMSLGVFGFL